jgi:hypothetical protein
MQTELSKLCRGLVLEPQARTKEKALKEKRARAKKEDKGRRRTMGFDENSKDKGIMDSLVEELSSGSAFRSALSTRSSAAAAAAAAAVLFCFVLFVVLFCFLFVLFGCCCHFFLGAWAAHPSRAGAARGGAAGTVPPPAQTREREADRTCLPRMCGCAVRHTVAGFGSSEMTEG